MIDTGRPILCISDEQYTIVASVRWTHWGTSEVEKKINPRTARALKRWGWIKETKKVLSGTLLDITDAGRAAIFNLK